MYKVKCVNRGITSRGQTFKPETIYTLSDEDTEYLVNTFPNLFIKLEKIATKKPKKSTTRTRKSKESTVEEVTDTTAEE